MLDLVDISIGYAPHNPIVKAISLSFIPGKVYALLGDNGMGKTTLAKTISGLLPPLSGKVMLHGRDITSLSVVEMANEVRMVPSEALMPEYMTMREFVELGRYPTYVSVELTSDDNAKVDRSLERMQIASLSTRPISELSSGERQKSMIASALASDAKIIILDEPTSHLDRRSRASLLDMLHHIAEEDNRAFIIISHDVEQTVRIAHSVVIIDNGRICTDVEAKAWIG